MSDQEYESIKKYFKLLSVEAETNPDNINNIVNLKVLYEKLFYRFLESLMDNWGGCFKIVHPDSIYVNIYSMFIWVFKEYTSQDTYRATAFLYKFLIDNNFKKDVINFIFKLSEEQRKYAQDVLKKPHPNYEECKYQIYKFIADEAHTAYYDMTYNENI